jgi:hypothetical protein
MKTTNIISTPNIEGNIGSCSVQSNEIYISKGILLNTKSVIQVNSCTGEVINQQTYTDYSNVVPASIAIIVFIAALITFYKLAKNMY